MRPHSRLQIAALSSLLLVTAHARGVLAGDWHNAQTACSECHTKHNSEGGAAVPGNGAPSPYALRRATSEELCLSCHDGSSSAAANVLSTNSTYVAAGGFFTAPIVETTHHLVKTATVPPGGTGVMVLTCTTCHDPHGNANYRNLRTNPNPNGGPISGGVVVKQTVAANGSNPAAVYVRLNLVDKSNVSIFCEACHGAPDPVSDHPDDKTMWGSTKASYARWACTSLIPGIHCATPALRTRATSPGDDAIPSQDDRVNCLSCHRAHGTAQAFSLYAADDLTVDSTCGQCHDQ